MQARCLVFWGMRDWDKAYREQDTPWDKGEPAPPLGEYLETHELRGSILVPGCGHGHDVRLLAAQGAEVTGLDIAPSALRGAKTVATQGYERYLLGDILALPDGLAGQFDWVFEHTCLCALEPGERSRYVDGVHAALKPGGKLLGIFFCIVEDYDGSGPPHPVSPGEIDRLFDGRFKTLEAWMPQKAYAGRQGGKEQMRVMQHLAT